MASRYVLYGTVPIQNPVYYINFRYIGPYTYFFYKQLGSGLSLQSCLYFQGFWGLQLRNGCLVV